MLPKNRVSTHPGEILLEDFLKPAGISQAAFAKHIGVDPGVISEIVNCRRGVSPEMALRFAAAFGDDPQTWCTLQSMHDITKAREKAGQTSRDHKIERMPQFAGV
jgi:addiction module HigA family antidote